MMQKLNDELLENVNGGARMYICNRGTVDYANIRVSPGTDSDVLAAMTNDTPVETTGITQDVNGVEWVQIQYTLDGGLHQTAWVAGHLLRK